MIQLLVIAGIAVAGLWSCSSPAEDELDFDAVGDDGPDANEAEARDADAPRAVGDDGPDIEAFDAESPDPDLAADEVAADEDETFDPADEDADHFVPVTPDNPHASQVGDIPCAFPASLSREAGSDALFVACGGATNALFRSSSPSGSLSWTQVGTVGGYPSHHISLDQGRHAVGHSYPDGVTIIDAQTGAAKTEIEFDTLAVPDPQGEPLPFTPNTPSGMVLAGGLLCVATSNMDHVDADPALTTYHPGTVICAPFEDGTLDSGAARAHPTSGLNPTGMALLDAEPQGDGSQRFAVLSSNSYAESPVTQAALEICRAPSMECTAIPLGAITAQMTPALHVTSGGLALVGVQKPAPGIIGVDTEACTVTMNRALPEVTNFISSISSSGHVAAVADFGPFGTGGALLFLDLRKDGWCGVPMSAIAGSTGPSAVIGETLYQTVTSNDGASGSLWKVELSGLQ